MAKKLPSVFQYDTKNFNPPAPVLEVSLCSPLSRGESFNKGAEDLKSPCREAAGGLLFFLGFRLDDVPEIHIVKFSEEGDQPGSHSLFMSLGSASAAKGLELIRRKGNRKSRFFSVLLDPHDPSLTMETGRNVRTRRFQKQG